MHKFMCYILYMDTYLYAHAHIHIRMTNMCKRQSIFALVYGLGSLLECVHGTGPSPNS